MIPKFRLMHSLPGGTDHIDILVLINNSAIESLRNELSQEIYRFIQAKTAQEAIQLLAERSFDLVLIDLQTDAAYVDLIYTIKRNSDLAFLPIILLVENDKSPSVLSGLNAGADDYVTRQAAPGLLEARLLMHMSHVHMLKARSNTITELQQSHDRYDQMIQMVTHDLRHPLTNIQIAEVMLRQADVNYAQTGLLDSVKAAVMSIYEMLEDFNTASSIQLNSMEVSVESVSVDPLMRQVFLTNAARINNKEMKVVFPESQLHVLADPEKLRRVLENLLTNAIKYSPSKSTITLDAIQSNGSVRLSVSDEGPGIPKDERHLLYRRFGRLSTRPTGEEASIGLGLWIVMKLVNAMNGQTGVESEFGNGATFWVELPLATT